MRIQIVIMQPQGYVHSLAFLDSARYLRFHLARLGVQAEISKNVAQSDRLNILLGAHLGVPEGWGSRCRGIVFNQEQIGDGGSDLPAEYLRLLRNSPVIDYDWLNLRALEPDTCPSKDLLRQVLPLLDAPYLRSAAAPLHLSKRPIDLLFFGSLNEARMHMIDRIERCGVKVVRFEQALYASERDHFISQSKAVLNVPFYASNRFERVRAFQCLSLGTPVVSLRRPGLVVEDAYTDAVQWFLDDQTEVYFKLLFGTPAWMQDSEERLEKWRSQDPIQAFSSLVKELTQLDRPSRQIVHTSKQDSEHSWRNLTPQWGQKIGWSDISSNPAADRTPEEGKEAYAALCTHLDSEVQSLLNRMRSAATELQTNGFLMLEWPLGITESDETAAQSLRDQAKARMRLALDLHVQMSVDGRCFELVEIEWINQACSTDLNAVDSRVISARFTLRKRLCTLAERMLQRTAQNDFGGVPEDSIENQANLVTTDLKIEKSDLIMETLRP